MRHTFASLGLCALTAVITASTASAQSSPAAPAAPAPIATAKPTATSYVTSDVVVKDSTKPQGLVYAVTLGANLNVAANRDVVGQINGNSVLFGASALGNIAYIKGAHEWVNNGSIAETWSRTPALGTFVKSNDLLDLQSLYNYFLREWTGPFIRAQIQTSLLKTNRVTPGQVTYVRDTDGALSTASRFPLSDSFQPFTLNESVGWFFQPVKTDVFNTYGRVGFGGRHTFADGARAVTDEKDPRGVEYTVLKDVHQAGAELFLGLDGKAVEGRLLYNLGVSALFPFANNDDKNRSIAELTKVGLQAATGMKVTSWLSVNYQLKLVRDVQLIDAIQLQNALMLSLNYTKSSPTPDKPKSDAELAKDRIAALETQLSTAEQRAAAAEARLNGLNGGYGSEPPAQPEPPAPPPATPVSPQPSQVPAPTP